LVLTDTGSVKIQTKGEVVQAYRINIMITYMYVFPNK